MIVDEDATVFVAYQEAIKERFPAEYALIIKAIDEDNIYHSLRTKDYYFKQGATDEECANAENALFNILEELNRPENLNWKKLISQSITKNCLDQIGNALHHNQNVLFDGWYIKADQLANMFPENQVIKVMLYCPLEVAYGRLLKRNEEAFIQGNLKEKRLTSQLVGSFYSLYEISCQPLQPIEKVELFAYNNTFQWILENLSDEEFPKKNFSFKEITRSELKQLQFKFLQPFGICESESFYISTKENYDLIIDNTTLDAKDAVQMIEEIL